MEDKQLASQEQSNQAITPAYYEDEISLVDLFLVLRRRKWIVIAISLGVVLLGFIYLAITEPVYESTAMLQVGQYSQPREKAYHLEDPQIFVARLKEKTWSANTGKSSSILRLSSASYQKRKAKTLITLKTSASSPEKAHESLNIIIQNILEEHRGLLDSVINSRKELISKLSERVEAMDKQIRQLNELISRTRKVDAAQAAVLAVEKSRLVGEVPEIVDRISTLQLYLSRLHTFPTQVIRKPAMQSSPVKPKRKLYIGISVVLGIVLGVFAAFFFEFISKLRRSIAEASAD